MVITDKDEAMEISTENCQLVMRPEKKIQERNIEHGKYNDEKDG